MSEIAKLYNDVMAGVEAEKLAEYENASHVAGDMDIDADFFAKVASGDEEAVDVMNNFIEEARAEGASDDEIEAAIAEAMEEAGVEEGEQLEDDEYEVAKAAAYYEGSEQAVADVLSGDLAKIAGVTAEDLVEFELGGFYGAGYAETRAQVEEVVEKIAMHKEAAKGKKKAAETLFSKLKGAPGNVHSGLANRYANVLSKHVKGYTASAKGADKLNRMANRLATGTMAVGGAGALGGAGYAAHKMRQKKQGQ